MLDLKEAIARAGGAVLVASWLGVTRSAIYDFIRRGKVPPEHCPVIEKNSNGAVRCEELNDSVDWAYIRATVDHQNAPELLAA